MQRIVTTVGVGLLLAFVMAPARSQQLQPPPPLAKPAQPSPKGVGPQLQKPQAMQPVKVPDSPGQRPQSSSPIPDAGPAKPVAVEPARPASQPTRPPRQPTQALDATGRPVRGLIQVSPSRAYDPATGRYYWTTPRTK
jgi:hypothetical protein